MLYRLLFHTVLRRLDAETAHRWSFDALRAAVRVPGVGRALRRVSEPRDRHLAVTAFGREFPGPLGIAAGFDKNAEGVEALTALGFGYVEVGTVTAQPQPGNPRPRLFRLVADRAIVNRMGFNNRGSAEVARRLRRLRRRGHSPITGANIGKTKVVPDSDSVADYVASARHLASTADYLVVNVSSPNTPGLRDFQAVDRLRPLLAGVREVLRDGSRTRTPLLVKIAPDLTDEAVDAVADLAMELELDGIIAANTTTTRPGLASAPAVVEAAGAGGLSGAPLKRRSLHVLRRLRARVGTRLVLIAAGGIETPQDAWERIRAGATLLQSYTGLIYHGPFWPRRIHRGLAKLTRSAGYGSVAEAVGTEAADPNGW